jgi:alpha-glucosidase
MQNLKFRQAGHYDVYPSERYDDVVTQYIPNQLQSTKKISDDTYELHTQNGIALRVQFVQENVIRFRYALKGVFEEDFSYAVVQQPANIKVAILENEEEIVLSSKKMVCRIDKTSLKVKIEDDKKQAICEETRGFYAESSILKGIYKVEISKKANADEVFHGLGDKACHINLRGTVYSNWCTDAFAFWRGSNEMYRAIPFYYSVGKQGAYGIFMDNSYRSHFDFCKANSTETAFAADGGEMNYYFIYGEKPLHIAQSYTALTGVPELPPLWALGFHQCRWSYYPEKRVREVAKEFRDQKIPCDAIYLDIDYMNGFRCFTWNHDHFPNPKKLTDDLLAEGFQTVVMIDPGIKEDADYHVFKEGVEQNRFVRRTDGTRFTGAVWPGDCAFPDFTNPKVRDWWGNLYKDLYIQDGVSGFWNDMNEPAVFEIKHSTAPDSVLHDFDGHPTNHAKAHNIYGLAMTRSSYEGFKTLRPEKRPFLLTRATYSGGQRYASVWTGDNCSSWEHLLMASVQCQRLSISGFSFCGTDIGGFAGECTGELMVRWLQLGAFHPVYRVHTMGNNAVGNAGVDEEAVKEAEAKNRQDQEPWSYGAEFTKEAKAAIELRYQLLPNIYTAFYEYITHGTPMLQPLSFAYPNDNQLITVEKDFLFGEKILVCPVVKARSRTQHVQLPAGTWYHYQSAKQFAGQQSIKIKSPIHQIPMFAKGGSIIFEQPVMQHVHEQPVTKLTMKVYFAEGSHTTNLYEDAGEGYHASRLRTFEVNGSDNQLVINTLLDKGNYQSAVKNYHIYLYGLPFVPKNMVCDGAAVPFKSSKNKIEIVLNGDFGKILIE